ncbi:serine hydrolase [Pseudoneobacillus sp. C159]
MYLLKVRKFWVLLSAVLMFFGMLSPNAFATTNTVAQQKILTLNPKEVEELVDSVFLNENLEALNFKGAVVSIVQGNKVILEKGYGYGDAEKQKKMDPNQTLVRIGSISKSTTATAVMKLASEGKINLEDDIQKYLNGYKIQNPFTEPVRIKHLLTHTSGFENRDVRAQDISYDLNTYVSLEDYIKEVFPPVLRKPGESYLYDNFAYTLLGYIMEQATGMSYEDYMEKEIYQKLKMNSTYSILTNELLDRTVIEYGPQSQPFPTYRFSPTSMPAGGVLTTAHDMTNFMMMHLNDGQFADKAFLSKENADLMHHFQTAINEKMPDTTYGFEFPGGFQFWTPSVTDEMVYYKGGQTLGSRSGLWMIPSNKIGIFLSYNSSVGELLDDKLYTLFMKKYFPAPATEPTFLQTPKTELARFEGMYQDLRMVGLTEKPGVYHLAATTHIAVVGDGQLLLTSSDAMMGTHLMKQIGPLLFMDERGQYLAFKVDEKGNPKYLRYLHAYPGYAEKIDFKPFSDISHTDPYASHIFALKMYGKINGYGDNTFKPTQTVTRGQFVEMIVKGFRLPVSENMNLPFTDVSSKSDRAKYIQTLFDMKVITGVSETKFAPSSTMTRQEAAVIFHRLMGSPSIPIPIGGEVDEFASDAVKTMIAYGIFGPEITVGADGTIDYQAKKELTRQEAALMIHKLSFLLSR